MTTGKNPQAIPALLKKKVRLGCGVVTERTAKRQMSQWLSGDMTGVNLKNVIIVVVFVFILLKSKAKKFGLLFFF